MKTIILILSAVAAFSAPKSPDKNLTDRLAAEYYANETKSLFATKASDPHRCEDQQEHGGPSCTDVACDLLGSFGCDSLSEVEQVGRACRGNYNGRCLRSMCGHLGSFGCDSLAEIEQVAGACRGSINEKCVDVACGYVGNFNCDSFSEIERIGAACNGVRSSCIESVCRRVGPFNCDSISEIEQVADSCRGN